MELDRLGAPTADPGPSLRWVLLLVSCLLGAGCGGEHQGPGVASSSAWPAGGVKAQDASFAASRQALAELPADRQILFGDLHTHTTFSPDAFLMSLPMLGGAGVHPPADACDFARFCADLDFWSINDHAEGISPRHWSETIGAIEQCNAVAGASPEPDLVSFLGWEWTQVGSTPDDHYGHKNVVLLETARERVPRRAIAAPRPDFRAVHLPDLAIAFLSLRYFSERQRLFDYRYYTESLQAVPECRADVDPHALPDDCHEVAEDPRALYAKLDAWDTPAIVIPHGTSWGLMTPPRFDLRRELAAGQHDPGRQLLLEIYSGHGSAEPRRDWPGAFASEDPACSAPSADFLPCCWQAGEIIRARCERESSPDCDERAAEARANYVAAGVAGHRTVPGASVEEWLDCDQCRDCFNPAFSHRPGGSAQHALAIRESAGDEAPRSFRFGFIGSSDTHDARPGNGFKEFARLENTEAAPYGDSLRDRREPVARSERVVLAELPTQGRRHMERAASFFLTGGLAAVHAAGRDRNAIWEAMERREVYATSGERILLWFELTNAPGAPAPMGAEVSGIAETPRFRVAAAGAFEQRPGCPDGVTRALEPDRLASLCLGECYHPGERRRRITRLEVVRIAGQQRPGEAIAALVEDPWRVFPCEDTGAGCVAAFDDPEFAGLGREVAYYARAIQEPTPAVNAGGLRCSRDAAGACLEVHPCYGDSRTPASDDCLAPNEERAWSSPIWLLPPSAG